MIFSDAKRQYVKGFDLHRVSKAAKEAFYELWRDGFINPFIQGIFDIDKYTEINITQGVKVYKVESKNGRTLSNNIFENPMHKYLIAHCMSEGYSMSEIMSMTWLIGLYNLFDNVYLLTDNEENWKSKTITVSGVEKIYKELFVNTNNQCSEFGYIGDLSKGNSI